MCLIGFLRVLVVICEQALFFSEWQRAVDRKKLGL
jgi:hypothetical protein